MLKSAREDQFTSGMCENNLHLIDRLHILKSADFTSSEN